MMDLLKKYSLAIKLGIAAIAAAGAVYFGFDPQGVVDQVNSYFPTVQTSVPSAPLVLPPK